MELVTTPTSVQVSHTVIMALYIWGFGKYGQLGNGATANVEVPQLVKPPSGFHPEKVSCGGHFTAVLCSSTKKAAGAASGASSSPGSKRVLACGWGKYGRLGTGSEEDKAILTEVCQHEFIELFFVIGCGCGLFFIFGIKS